MTKKVKKRSRTFATVHYLIFPPETSTERSVVAYDFVTPYSATLKGACCVRSILAKQTRFFLKVKFQLQDG